MPSARPEPMAVIGAGSWGTALAIQLARAGHPTLIWGRDGAQLDTMRQARCNERYLPNAAFPAALAVAADLSHALRDGRDALIAVPSHAFRTTLMEIEPYLSARSRVAWATKGFEIATGLLPHQVASEILGPRPGAVLSGPTFAKEVGAGLPTAMTVASRDDAFAEALAARLSGPNFRAYRQTDIVGVEVGGAVKNVIAIGSGIADGMGFGANTRVALITRGLAEMMRLGVRLGGMRDTFMGLAGLTINPAIVAWVLHWAEAGPLMRHKPVSNKWWRVFSHRAPSAPWPHSCRWTCPLAARFFASCTRANPCTMRYTS
jgi:glycerol-3-phosphate dehydrogenase (NAD(P)+)